MKIIKIMKKKGLKVIIPTFTIAALAVGAYGFVQANNAPIPGETATQVSQITPASGEESAPGIGGMSRPLAGAYCKTDPAFMSALVIAPGETNETIRYAFKSTSTVNGHDCGAADSVATASGFQQWRDDSLSDCSVVINQSENGITLSQEGDCASICGYKANFDGLNFPYTSRKMIQVTEDHLVHLYEGANPCAE